MKKLPRIIAIIIIILIGVVLFYTLVSITSNRQRSETELGVTFSKKFAQYMGLEWKETYTAILDELGVRYLRLPVYWDEVENELDEYVFEDLVWQVEEAQKREARIVMVVGMRQPRWPECHLPTWVKELSDEERNLETLELIEQTIKKFKSYKNIEVWQVENEPFLDFFGECPHLSKEVVEDEVELVSSLDDRPTMVTASGELSTWIKEAGLADLLGSTLYRTTYNKYLGYGEYFFLPPSSYRVKAALVGKPLNNYWVMELQAEPWFRGDPLAASLEDSYETMNPVQLRENIEYVKKVGVPRAYLWGAEWWYYVKEKFDDNQMWEAAKGLDW